MTAFRKAHLVLFLFSLLFSNFSYAKEDKKEDVFGSENGYTINYNNVSVIEYIRFVSKITGINFIFNDEDLNFNVTVVSEDPISKENVMATLTQVLRINNLEVLEENNNLVIHKNPEVKQFSHLVFNDEEMDKRFPLTTRVFRVKEAKASAIAAIIRPMISQQSILDVSAATNQVILTDITPNVEKVSLLIENLDSPVAKLTIEPYRVKHNNPGYLINIANQIMAPLSQGNPFILVNQAKSHEIFIVSTPSLVEKTISVLSSLDSVPKKDKLDLSPDNIYIYKLKHRSMSDVLRALHEIAKNIQASGYTDKGLVETIDTVKPVKDSDSLLFTGDTGSLAKVREILGILDVSTEAAIKDAQESFFVYMPIHKSPEEVEKGIHEVAEKLRKSKLGDKNLLETLQSSHIVTTTQSIVFTGDPATFSKVKELLATIDVISTGIEGGETFYIYKIQNVSETQLQKSLKDMAHNLEKSGVSEKGLIRAIDSMKYLPDTDSLFFAGSKTAIGRLKEIIPTFDQKLSSEKQSSQFLAYKPKFLRGEEIYKAMKEYAANLRDSGLTDPTLLRAIGSMKWVKSTNSLLFTGDPASLQKVEGLLTTIDAPSQAPGLEQTFFVYQLEYAPKDKVREYLLQVAKTLEKEGLKEDDLVQAIQTMKWIPQSHSYMFTGSQNALGRIKVMLKDFDIPSEKAISEAQPTFVIIPIQNVSEKMAEDYLQQIAANLNRTNEKQDRLYQAIESMKWIQQSRSFMFSGTKEALNSIAEMMKDFDVPGQRGFQKNFFTYQLQHVTKEKFEAYLENFATNLQKNQQNPDLVETIESMKWIPDSHSFMFSGTEASLDRLKEIIKNYDTTSEKGESYFLYKLQFAQGDEIEDDLDRFAKNMKEAGLAQSSVIQVIDNVKWVKATNSLLLTGDPTAIEEVKKIIAEYDVQERPDRIHSEFIMYKPVYVSPKTLEDSLLDIAKNLKQGGLVDQGLLSAIESVKFSQQTGTLIFTGSQQALQKIAGLIKEIDVETAHESSIQHLGKTTFLLYKLKNANGAQVVKSLDNVLNNLEKSDSDPEFTNTLKTMKYIRETNSLLFTGPEQYLERVRTLVEKFDLPTLGDKSVAPTDYFIYKPEYVPGPQLETLLNDFADHLKQTGLSDPELFNSIRSAKYVEKSNSLIFTGDEQSLGKIKQLLKTFDVPGGELSHADAEIQPIDNTSFLVYKLQYHKGSEIKSALKHIGSDLLESHTTVNQSLLHSIASIQWLEVTNSLLITGDQDTLTRLKELIKSLDVPLKQVFIEVLAIETTLSNFLDFGLNWGAKANYRNRFSASTSNFNTNANTTNSAPQTFANGLANVNGTTTPDPKVIPFQTGFDFGVIGDIIFHKGRSFLSLGSLLNALQIDQETTVLLTPKILGQDNKTSTLFVGQNIPFAGSFTQTVGAATQTNQNVEYRDIGVNLTITPVLGNSDIVTLDILIENTVLASDVQGQQADTSNVSGFQALTTNKTSMQTTVSVPNESFLILSGMLDITKRREKNGIPCLGGIPLIGAAFSLLNKTDNHNNIVFFIRPHIINSYEDMKQITRDQEDMFRESAGTPYLETEFDEGMEFIKSVDDE